MKLAATMVLWCVFQGSVSPQPQLIKTYENLATCQKARVRYEQHNVVRGVRCSCKRTLDSNEEYKPAWAVEEKYR